MTENGISDRLASFLAGQIDSVVQVEALLLLHSNPRKRFPPEDVARELRIDPLWAGPNLHALCTRRLLACETDPMTVYYYAPQTHELAAMIDELAVEYAARRVSVITTIFSKPRSPLKHFSDAFRLRKEKNDG